MTANLLPLLEQVFQSASVAVAFGAVAAAVASALKSGIIRQLSSAKMPAETGITPEDVRDLKSNSQAERPFETAALANYYNHALMRANISFWFSLIFAAIGFGVIILAFATHNGSDIWGTIIKVASGAVIDAVSGLFFVQSTSAQKSMGEFFEKLRLDRMNAEARELISEIENVERRDQLRAQLVLKYAGIERLLEGK